MQSLIPGLKKIIESYGEQVTSHAIFVKDISRDAVILTIEYFTQPVPIRDFFQQKNNILLQVKQLLEDNKVAFAGDSSNIIIKEENREG